jgi:23S rRNA pseudouridine1911/1915/1917 synthase
MIYIICYNKEEVIQIKLNYRIQKEEEGQKIKHILIEKLHISSRLLIKLKLANKISCNGLKVYTSHTVKENDLIEADIDFEEEDNIKPEMMDLAILYEDEYIIAINKPAGVVVHPSMLHQDSTLANGLKYYLNNKKKIRPINRLDRDTSGIVLFAKNEYVQECIEIIYKEYIAIVEGKPIPTSGTINAPIERKAGSIIERCISNNGQNAVTKYEVIKTYNNISALKLVLLTGRTHQIRVHMAYIGNPVLGDTLYGTASNLIDRQALHSYKTDFIHPITKDTIRIQAPIPEDIKKIIEKLK